MKSQYTITAVLTTMSPLHITQPGSHRVDLNGKTVSEKEGFPCPQTTKMWLSSRPVLSQLVDGDAGEPTAGQRPVPCIPANSIRGQLRRQAARSIMQGLLAKGERLSIVAYNVLQCGAATGSPDSNPSTVEEAVMADGHPYFGLFGGGPRLIRSNLRVDTALAITETSLPYLRAGFEGAVNSGQLTSVGWMRRNDDALQLTDLDMQRKVIREAHEALNEHQDAAMSAKKSGDTDAASDSDKVLSRFNALEYVRPGVHFALRLDLDGTEVQAGLLLDAVLGFLRANRIGGGGRRGFGRFMLQSVMLNENGELHSIGDRMTDETAVLKGRGAELLAAWKQAQQELSAGEIESISKPEAKKQPAAKKAKGKAAETEKA